MTKPKIVPLQLTVLDGTIVRQGAADTSRCVEGPLGVTVPPLVQGATPYPPQKKLPLPGLVYVVWD